MIEKNNGIKIDINNMKYDDMNVFEYIAKVKHMGFSIRTTRNATIHEEIATK